MNLPTNPNSTIPQINPDVVAYLERTFKPVTSTLGIDIRVIDHRSGQFSVVEHLKQLVERQRTHST